MSDRPDPKLVRQGKRPIPVCRCHDLQADTWSVRVAFETPLGSTVKDIPNVVFYKREKCLDFLDQHGFARPLSKPAQEQLHEALVRSVPEKTCLLTRRLGWNDSVYVRRSGNIGSNTVLEVEND